MLDVDESSGENGNEKIKKKVLFVYVIATADKQRRGLGLPAVGTKWRSLYVTSSTAVARGYRVFTPLPRRCVRVLFLHDVVTGEKKKRSFSPSDQPGFLTAYFLEHKNIL